MNANNRMTMRSLTCIFLALCFTLPCIAESRQEVPILGGQVIIEPGQSDSEIERWFQILNENGMKVCRIRMFEEYMHDTASDSWDFSLFDKAFSAAERHGIRIFATLFPRDKNNASSLGGFKLPADEAHLARIERYIEKTVSHFSQFTSLHGWVLINEPGTGGWLPPGSLTDKLYRLWRDSLPESPYKTNYRRLVNFDAQRFLTDYNSWYLQWLATQVRKYDPRSEIHVNNHQLFELVAEYDFPAWRQFLTSLGTSAHPSWHFNYFQRSRYAVALAANCEIIRSGAGSLPFLITELQGGNNTYSGDKSFCPTDREITQWLWTGIGTGARGIIFWSLNPRSIGEEAGEWALIDFQGNNTSRLDAVRDVARCLEQNRLFFEKARTTRSPVTILYNRESLWVETKAQGVNGKDPNYEGRNRGGVMKSALAFYELLAENGLKTQIGEINEFDWSRADYAGECIIFANQVVIPSYRWNDIRRFVECGGLLIVEGLSGFYDENMQSLHNTGFPLKDVFGGELREVNCQPGDTVGDLPDKMPVHLWTGYIHVGTGIPLSGSGRCVTALRNTCGRGKVIWIPSLVGLGAIRTQDKEPLAGFLRKELLERQNPLKTPFFFQEYHPGVIMQTLTDGVSYVTILINKHSESQCIRLNRPDRDLQPQVIFSNGRHAIKGERISIDPEITLVIKWNGTAGSAPGMKNSDTRQEKNGSYGVKSDKNTVSFGYGNSVL